MADPTTGTTDTGGCKGSKNDCCECCTEIFEMRAMDRSNRDARDKTQNLALANSVAAAARLSALAASNDDLAQKAFVTLLTQPQDNPIGVAGVASLNAGAAAQNGIANGTLQSVLGSVQALQSQYAALVAMIANLAHSTPSSPGSTAQQTGVATKAA